MGRKPSTKYPDATDIPSQAAPLSDGSTLRHRKPSHQPTDPAPEPWAPRRHNTLVEGIAEEPAPPVPLSWESERTKTPRRPLPFSSPQYEEHVDPEKGHHRLRRIAHFKSDSRDHSPHLHHSRRHPIARKWSTPRKRIVATVACINTGIIGFVVGIYAGMVPRIQFQLADQRHEVIRGNVLLYFGLAITTFLTWPLPLLHGRKPYILGALAIILPLQFPQAVIVSLFRTPKLRFFHLSVVICRFCTGLVLGFANVNCFTVLLDLFGASLQSSRPHQEIVVYNDIRRDGGGMGVWLGIWTWCFIGSIGVGFFCGAAIIGPLNPAWGFYVTIIVISCVIVINVIMPETRRSAHRRTVRLNIDSEEKLLETTIWGEAKLHVTGVSPRNWLQEVWAGLVLNQRMLRQQGFVILAVYVAWIYAMVVLVIILLGALLSRSYRLQPKFVGLGVFSISVGALLAVPLSKASLLSRDRKQGPRTDSMTFDREISWSSHLARRLIFMTLLPLAGAAYTVTSPGVSVHFMAPILFAGTVGFLSNLAIAECMGLVMETFDTSDLQPGVNSRHRLQSLAEDVRRRRTNYSSFPRVAAGVFMMQSLGFVFAACATEGGGSLTRNLGARLSTGVVAIILAILTVLLTLSLWRFRSIRVLPDHSLGTRVNTNEWTEQMQDPEWKPVVVGNPSGKMRRMSLLEMGSQSRWTEIRRLNKLLE
ncbi:hypothetical protein EJ06DRAFT_474349 [Trichodelitschia bisporula]|uniref:MFS general substrate transporter n=1 Tax=Trichodelitschia bisporula TaxID=703511 RepID=A0A6G1I0X5_9PEZI|nr:hypothetical protein EJ06DRAFT_474349 [Trichodelitschia bisporula]